MTARQHREMTMTPSQVLTRLNNHHRAIIFPRMFDQKITFDMVAEVEYSFELKNLKLGVTQSEFWRSANRDPTGNFVIKLPEQEGMRMGRWLHHVIDPKSIGDRTGKIGFTVDRKNAMDESTVDVVCSSGRLECPDFLSV